MSQRISALLAVSLLFFAGAVQAGEAEGQAAARAGDFNSAVREFLPLAEQGYAGAQVNLGNFYLNGLKDPLAAYPWFQKSAAQDFPSAQNALGMYFYLGRPPVKEDNLKAREWFQKAGLQGDSIAQFFLGEIYRKGDGIAVDLKQALGWYLKSAEQNFPNAQFRLGLMYANAEGVDEPDMLQAYKWASLAKSNGATNAADLLAAFSKNMKPDEILQASELLRQFVAKQ